MRFPSVPISPQRAKDFQYKAIPGFVFEEVNRLVADRINQGRAIVAVAELTSAIRSRMAWFPEYGFVLRLDGVPPPWLSLENIRRTYEPEGWQVGYKPPTSSAADDGQFIFNERG